jgi:hypothetical protein
MDKFKRHDTVKHVKTKNLYMIILGPKDGVTLESNSMLYLFSNLDPSGTS